MTDTFDAVLAEMRKVAPAGWAHIHGSDIDGWADRLAAAHAAEVATIRAHIEGLEARVRELEGVVKCLRAILPVEVWADDARRMADAAMRGEGE